jgi:hypothetical protein
VIIRFPTSARLDGKPMATRVNVFKRIWWRLFGHRRRANVAKLRLDRARRYG